MTQEKKHIVVALSRFPYPIDKGDKLRAYYQIKGLSREYNIHLISLNPKKVPESHVVEVSKYCQSVQIIVLPLWRSILNLLLFFGNSLPLQSNYFHSRKMSKVIKSTIETTDAQLIYVQLIRLYNNIPFGLPIKYMLDYMDAFSLGMEKRSERSKFPLSILFKIESIRVHNLEKNIAAKFDGLSIITKNELQALPVDIRNQVSIVPNGISRDFFVDNRFNKEFDLIFLGNMSYYPNVQASKYLVKEILPLLIQSHPAIRICLVGTNPSLEVRQLQSKHVTVTGYVRNVSDYLIRSRLFVAPLFTGQGLQNKVLESLAASIPIITTPLVYHSFEKADESGMIVCDSPEMFCDQIGRLLNNPTECESLGATGRQFVKNNYDWEVSNQKLITQLNNLVN